MHSLPVSLTFPWHLNIGEVGAIYQILTHHQQYETLCGPALHLKPHENCLCWHFGCEKISHVTYFLNGEQLLPWYCCHKIMVGEAAEHIVCCFKSCHFSIFYSVWFYQRTKVTICFLVHLERMHLNWIGSTLFT